MFSKTQVTSLEIDNVLMDNYAHVMLGVFTTSRRRLYLYLSRYIHSQWDSGNGAVLAENCQLWSRHSTVIHIS